MQAKIIHNIGRITLKEMGKENQEGYHSKKHQKNMNLRVAMEFNLME